MVNLYRRAALVDQLKDYPIVIDGFQIFFIFLYITLLMKRYLYLDVLSEKEKAEILHKDVAIDLSEHSFMRSAPTRGWKGIIENTLHALTK